MEETIKALVYAVWPVCICVWIALLDLELRRLKKMIVNREQAADKRYCGDHEPDDRREVGGKTSPPAEGAPREP